MFEENARGSFRHDPHRQTGGLYGLDDALRVARKIVAAMRARFVLESGAAALSASAGIAFHDGTAEVSPAALIAAADRALYEAKAAGRDGYRAAE